MDVYQNLKESAEYIRGRLNGFTPEIMVVLGSGLSFLADLVEEATCVPYGDIPHFKPSTAPGHEGRFVFGRLRGKPVALMQGRLHCYEGYSGSEVVYPLRCLKLLGVHTVLLTNAAGAINTSFAVSDIMLIEDHIKLFSESALKGPNIDELGPRFCDMSYAYDQTLRQLAKTVAKEQGIALKEGVYFYFPGPQFETPAEIRLARLLGGDVAGMSTVHEAIAANHCGMRVLGFSLVTNMGAGVTKERLDGVDVIRAAENAKEGLSALLLGCVERM